jgi:hypothetical protein
MNVRCGFNLTQKSKTEYFYRRDASASSSGGYFLIMHRLLSRFSSTGSSFNLASSLMMLAQQTSPAISLQQHPYPAAGSHTGADVHKSVLDASHGGELLFPVQQEANTPLVFFGGADNDQRRDGGVTEQALPPAGSQHHNPLYPLLNLSGIVQDSAQQQLILERLKVAQQQQQQQF